MTRRARSLPARRLSGSAALVAVLLVLFAQLSTGNEQTLLPPDPSKTIGGKVSFAGFVDETGRDAAALIGAPGVSERAVPWIVSPIYTRCAYTCSPLTASLRSALEQSGLQPSEYRVVSFSFDPEETGEALRAFRTALQLPDGWLTLRAADRGALERTLRSLDFRTIKLNDGQFAHPNLIAVLAPDLRLTEYVFGVTFPPKRLAGAVQRARAGGSWWVPWQGSFFVMAGIGLLTSTFVFFSLLKRRRA